MASEPPAVDQLRPLIDLVERRWDTAGDGKYWDLCRESNELGYPLKMGLSVNNDGFYWDGSGILG